MSFICDDLMRGGVRCGEYTILHLPPECKTGYVILTHDKSLDEWAKSYDHVAGEIKALERVIKEHPDELKIATDEGFITHPGVALLFALYDKRIRRLLKFPWALTTAVIVDLDAKTLRFAEPVPPTGVTHFLQHNIRTATEVKADILSIKTRLGAVSNASSTLKNLIYPAIDKAEDAIEKSHTDDAFEMVEDDVIRMDALMLQLKGLRNDLVLSTMLMSDGKVNPGIDQDITRYVKKKREQAEQITKRLEAVRKRVENWELQDDPGSPI